MPTPSTAQTMTVLPNGMRVIFRQNTSNNILAALCFINVGGLDETDHQKGITNFVQQVILKGTSSRTAKQIAEQTESRGISLGADAADDYACVSIVCLADDASRAFEIFADVIFNPSFPPDEVEKERDNILMNMRLSEDDSFYYTYKYFRRIIFRGHPYAVPPEGLPESVSRISRDELMAWHAKHFVPGNMVLSIVGNLSERKMKSLVKRHFAGRQGPAPARMSVGKDFIPEYRIERIERDVEQSFIVIGYLAPEISRHDWAALRVAAAILGEGMSSRLFRHLRDEQGLAYAVGTSLPARREKSAIMGYIGTKGETTNHAREEMIRQFRRLCHERVDNDELQRTKNYIVGRYVMDHQRNSRQAWYLGWYELVGKGWQYDDQYVSDIESVTADDIYKVANKYFTEPTVVQLEPAPGAGALKAGVVQ